MKPRPSTIGLNLKFHFGYISDAIGSRAPLWEMGTWHGTRMEHTLLAVPFDHSTVCAHLVPIAATSTSQSNTSCNTVQPSLVVLTRIVVVVGWRCYQFVIIIYFRTAFGVVAMMLVKLKYSCWIQLATRTNLNSTRQHQTLCKNKL